MDCIIIRLVDLPDSVPAVTVKDENDDYNMYINARMSADARAKAYWHEIEHIRRGHFYSSLPVSEMERQAKACATKKRTAALDE